MARRVLAIAIAKGRTGYVYLAEGDLLDWGLSVQAVRSANALAAWLQKLINELQPDVVVTEEITEACRKGRRTKRLIKAAADITSHNYVYDVSVERPRNHACKYSEAEAFSHHYQELAGWVPKRRRYFESEPRQMIIFEALAFAEAVSEDPDMQKTA